MGKAASILLQLLTLLAMSQFARSFSNLALGTARPCTSVATQHAILFHGSPTPTARNHLRRHQRQSFATSSHLRGGGVSMSAGGGDEETLVQYVVLRRDLAEQGWPMGSIVAQGCHAVSKALWELKEEENVIKYCADIDSMHKVVLGARDEKTLRKVAQKLEENGLKHRLWIEQPEDYATALAVMPYPRSTIAPYLKKLSLLK